MNPFSSSSLLGFLGMPGHLELLIVGLVALLFFGNRLPGVMRAVGQSITELRRGIRGELSEPDETHG